MTDAARQPKDENYNLIAVLYQSSDNVGSLKTYIQNAQHEATRNSSSSSAGSWRTTFVWHSGPRRCSFPRFQGKQELPKGLFRRAGVARACTFCSYFNAKTAGSISLHQKGQGVTPRPFVRSRPYLRDR